MQARENWSEPTLDGDECQIISRHLLPLGDIGLLSRMLALKRS